MKVLLDSTLIVPAECVNEAHLELFTPVVVDRDGNPHIFQFYKYDDLNGTIHFARGKLDTLKEFFGHLPWQDLRASVPMASRTIGPGLQFTGKLRPSQLEAANKILSGGGFGQVNCPPRFGKTITMIYVACQLQLRTIWLVHQIDLCVQALKSFREFTNVFELEHEAGRRIIDKVDKWEDILDLDVAILPYQRFISTENNLEKLREAKDSFGVCIVDECHRSSAPRYQEVVETFNPQYRLGCSGTTERKDQMHVVNQFVLGPVVVRGTAPQMPCEVHMVRTGTKIDYNSTLKTFFVKMLTFLAKNKERNALIVEQMKRWAEKGYTIVAVSDRTAQCDILASALKSAGFSAEAFHRSLFSNNDKREACLSRVRKGETQVLVMMRTMTTGIDIPRATVFFNLLPTANGPSYYQEFCRVRTPNEGKERAFIIDFVDDHPVAIACSKTRRKLYEKERFLVNG